MEAQPVKQTFSLQVSRLWNVMLELVILKILEVL